MFRDYVLVLDPDATVRRRLVQELGERYPILVVADAEGAQGRLRRWGPPMALITSLDLDASPGGAELRSMLERPGARTTLVRIAPTAQARDAEPEAFAPLCDVAFEIERGNLPDGGAFRAECPGAEGSR